VRFQIHPFPQDKASGRVGLEIIPAAALGKIVPRRETLRGLPFIDAMPGNDPWPASVVESLVQFKLVGDQYPGAFAQDHTLRQSGSVAQFKSVEQKVLKVALHRFGGQRWGDAWVMV